ncbi:MAG: thioredoxin domain-containing protein, partial [Longimicrobiales bacterium]
GEPRALEMAVQTLRCMAAGGMRDHIGGGFHRYSVDSRWLVPHFEKMLYDNALLARAYLDAWRLTDSDDLREVLLDTLDYVSKDLTDSTGGFYSARDADSEGEEGTFYVWTIAEIDSILGPDAGLFNRIYGVTEGGNFEGRNIPHLVETVDELALATGLPEGVLEEKIAACRAKLFEARQKREAPFRDEKIIVSWNGLAIRAFAEAGAALGRADYVDVASRAAEHVWSHLRPDDRLLHSSMAGEAKGLAFLDDHASLGNALLSLHAATLEPKWLDAAVWLANEVVTRFWDEESGTVFDTAADAETLILRPRDPMDNATPSGPSLAAELLARIGQIMSRSAWLDISRRIVDPEADAMKQFRARLRSNAGGRTAPEHRTCRDRNRRTQEGRWPRWRCDRPTDPSRSFVVARESRDRWDPWEWIQVWHTATRESRTSEREADRLGVQQLRVPTPSQRSLGTHKRVKDAG